MSDSKKLRCALGFHSWKTVPNSESMDVTEFIIPGSEFPFTVKKCWVEECEYCKKRRFNYEG